MLIRSFDGLVPSCSPGVLEYFRLYAVSGSLALHCFQMGAVLAKGSESIWSIVSEFVEVIFVMIGKFLLFSDSRTNGGCDYALLPCEASLSRFLFLVW